MQYSGGPNEARKRHLVKKYAEAEIVDCACGCGLKIKAINRHGKSRKYVNGHSNRKYDDPAQYKSEYRKAHKDELRERRLEARRSRKIELILYKGGKCTRCGIAYDGKNGPIFHFHHAQGIKRFGLSAALYEYSMETLKSEADVCDLVCSNCHALLHAGEY